MSAPILPETIATPCQGDNTLISKLTQIDWVVLDFANGKRTFHDLASILPTEQSAIMSSFRHLEQLGFLRWETPQQNVHNQTNPRFVPNKTSPGARCSTQTDPVSMAMADLSDSECLQYLPQRLLVPFRSFTPKLADPSLDIELGTQALIEFLSINASTLTPSEILGVSPDASKTEIRQAYLKRSRLYHPDRFFRKNIGVFSTHLANLFKAVTRAFGALQ